MPIGMTQATLTENTATVAQSLDRNRVVWQRTYAPLRRALAGKWCLSAAGRPIELSLDAEGGFTLWNAGANLKIEGRFDLASVNGNTYLVLDSEVSRYALRIEELNTDRMRLRWADDGQVLVLDRFGPTAEKPRLELL